SPGGRTPPPRPRSVSRSLALGAAGFCASVSWQIVLPVLPLRLAHLGYGPAQIGVLAGIFSLAMAAVELQAGGIAAAIGRRWSILAGHAPDALGLPMASSAPAPPAGARPP